MPVAHRRPQPTGARGGIAHREDDAGGLLPLGQAQQAGGRQRVDGPVGPQARATGVTGPQDPVARQGDAPGPRAAHDGALRHPHDASDLGGHRCQLGGGAEVDGAGEHPHVVDTADLDEALLDLGHHEATGVLRGGVGVRAQVDGGGTRLDDDPPPRPLGVARDEAGGPLRKPVRGPGQQSGDQGVGLRAAWVPPQLGNEPGPVPGQEGQGADREVLHESGEGQQDALGQADDAPLTGGVGGQGELAGIGAPLRGGGEDAQGAQHPHLPGGHREGAVGRHRDLRLGRPAVGAHRLQGLPLRDGVIAEELLGGGEVVGEPRDGGAQETVDDVLGRVPLIRSGRGLDEGVGVGGGHPGAGDTAGARKRRAAGQHAGGRGREQSQRTTSRQTGRGHPEGADGVGGLGEFGGLDGPAPLGGRVAVHWLRHRRHPSSSVSSGVRVAGS